MNDVVVSFNKSDNTDISANTKFKINEIIACIQADYHLMQFTGLYDKNGNEIWEGDVVSLNGEGTYLVTWDEEDCLFKFGNSPVFEACAYKAKIIVIGNIFENPELVGECNIVTGKQIGRAHV